MPLLAHQFPDFAGGRQVGDGEFPMQGLCQAGNLRERRHHFMPGILGTVVQVERQRQAPRSAHGGETGGDMHLLDAFALLQQHQRGIQPVGRHVVPADGAGIGNAAVQAVNGDVNRVHVAHHHIQRLQIGPATADARNVQVKEALGVLVGDGEQAALALLLDEGAGHDTGGLEFHRRHIPSRPA